ncbi:hypothetical protein [Pseudomonas sp.]|uniref:hypothetical protein n=1 Tax=Pseudomonas sp. TaxID=306 RepID=UPI0028A81D56|nr:hypothetical protein [Pseudomonas sp.]
MYRIPEDLDLSGMVGEFTTQILVGQFDMQFSFGKYHFAVQSNITLVRNGEVIGVWQEGVWPPSQFFEIMNVSVVRCQIPDDRTIAIYLDNDIEIHLKDNSDEFESMQISIDGELGPWII